MNHFTHFRELPQGSNILYTMTLLVLGMGYLFAMLYLFEMHAGRDGKPGLSVDDVMIAYSGSQEDTRLEAAVKGPMSGMLHKEDVAEIVTWARGDAGREQFQADDRPDSARALPGVPRRR